MNRVIENQEVHPLKHYYAIADKLFIGYLILFTLIFSIVFGLLSSLNLLDLFVSASTLMALLFSGGAILKKVLSAPFFHWNANRLAWTFSLIRGYQLYYSADSGPVLSTSSGPLRALIYLPATLFNSPTSALIFASFISVSFYFLPILWLHFGKNLFAPRKLLFALYGFVCFCLFTLSSRTLTYTAPLVYSDTPALGFSAVACAVLYYRKGKESIPPLLLSALFSVFAVWTKQTLVPILFALPTYILLTDGYRCFKRYILCLCVCGVVVSALFLWVFNAQNLLFYMFTIPSHCPWQFSTNRIVALLTATSHLIKESLLFAAILIFYSVYQLSISSNVPNRLKAWLISNQWTMLAIVSLFMVPTSVLGRVKVGGDVNTLSPTVYFLAAAVSLALIKFASGSLSSYTRLTQSSAKILLVLLITGLICVNIPNFWGIPSVLNKLPGNKQKVAYEYAKKHPGEVYFPTNPLSSLLAEGKLYHHAYGLFDRELSGFRVSDEHFQAHIPTNIRLVAFQSHIRLWLSKYVMNYLPEFSKRVTIDELPGWVVYVRE
ncbi:MAG: hypothetical protein ACETWM_11675 [Candidatus Lokiarchaeia archaeon]